MENAYIVGALYALFGLVLLFFGSKLMKLVLVVLGGIVGLNIGQLLVSWLGMHDIWAFLTIVVCAVAVASVAVAFYKLFVAASIGYLLGLLAYALFTAWNWPHTLSVVLAVIIGVAVGLAVHRANVVELAFKFITSVQGATSLVSGVYVMFYTAKLQSLQTNQYDVLLGASVWWVLFWVIALVAGLGYQLQEKPAVETEALA